MGNSSDRLTVKMGLRLSQIIGVDMKRQILITNVWLEQVRGKKNLRLTIYCICFQEWLDYKLKWKPEEYGNIRHLHVPSQHIWLPDIVLYNKCVSSLIDSTTCTTMRANFARFASKIQKKMNFFFQC